MKILKPSLFVLALVISSNLQATNLNEIQKIYKEKNYDLSLSLAKEYIKSNPQDIKANLFLANSAIILKKYHEALAALDRVLILEPNNIYARMQICKIYYKTNNKKMLKLELDYLKTQTLTNEQEKKVKQLSQKSHQEFVPKKNLFIALSIGSFYDSNVNSNIGDKLFKVPALGTSLKGEKQERSFAHFENMYIYGNVKSKLEGVNIGISADVYNKAYFDSKFKSSDLTFLSLNLLPSFSDNSLSFLLPIKVEHTVLNYKNLLTSYMAGLEVDKMFDWGFMGVGAQFKANLYSKMQNKEKDFNEGYFFIKAKKIEQNYEVGMMFDYDITQERVDLRSDVSYDRYGFSMDYYQKIVSNIFTKVDFSVRRYEYKDFNNKFLNKREDTAFRIGLGLNYILNKNSSLSLTANYFKKKSNQALYQYDRITSNIYYTYRF